MIEEVVTLNFKSVFSRIILTGSNLHMNLFNWNTLIIVDMDSVAMLDQCSTAPK